MDDFDLIAVWLWLAACVVGLTVCLIVLITDSIHAHRMERMAMDNRKTCKVCGEEKRDKDFPPRSNKCKRCTTIERQQDPAVRQALVDYYMRGIGPRDY